MALSLSLACLDARVRGEHRLADIPACLGAALAADGADGRPVQLIADLHRADNQPCWRRSQLERIRSAFVADLDLGDRDAPAHA
jgi:hypothetical protein